MVDDDVAELLTFLLKRTGKTRSSEDSSGAFRIETVDDVIRWLDAQPDDDSGWREMSITPS